MSSCHCLQRLKQMFHVEQSSCLAAVLSLLNFHNGFMQCAYLFNCLDVNHFRKWELCPCHMKYNNYISGLTFCVFEMSSVAKIKRSVWQVIWTCVFLIEPLSAAVPKAQVYVMCDLPSCLSRLVICQFGAFSSHKQVVKMGDLCSFPSHHTSFMSYRLCISAKSYDSEGSWDIWYTLV